MRHFVFGVCLMTLGCGGEPIDNNGEEIDPCEKGRPASVFGIGTIEFEQPRQFAPLQPDCANIEVVSGIQGGWHIEPAIQAPIDAMRSDLEGTFEFSVMVDGQQITEDAEFELRPNFWQDVTGGFSYYGDSIIFREYPDTSLGKTATLRLKIAFIDDSVYDNETIETTIRLVDDNEEF